MLSRILMASSRSGGPTGDPAPSLLVVSWGESNTGGQVANSAAMSWEVGPRPELKIWNFNASAYQSLDIGTNNNLDHTNMAADLHAWELQLANRIRQGYYGSKSVYLCQTGHGGSTISQWGEGGAYWTKFLSRVAGAKAAIAGPFNIAVWVEFGINDGIAGTTPAAYKSGVQEIFSRIKAAIPFCKIYMTTMPLAAPDYVNYNAKIAEIASEDPSTVRVVNVHSPLTLDMQDGWHWSYVGMKRLSARMTDATLADLGVTGKSVTFGARNDAGWHYATEQDTNAVVSPAIDVTVDGWVAFELLGGSVSAGFVFGIDSESTPESWVSTPRWKMVYSVGSNCWTDEAGNNLELAIDAPCWVRFRWSSANDDLVLEGSTDGGSTWSNQYTWSNALVGLSQVYLKSTSAVGAAQVDVWRS